MVGDIGRASGVLQAKLISKSRLRANGLLNQGVEIERIASKHVHLDIAVSGRRNLSALSYMRHICM